MRPPTTAAHIRRLRPYVPGKPVEEVKRELGVDDVVKLASNENPLGPSPRAVAAIRAAAERVYQYPDASCHRLVHALADHWRVDPRQVIAGNGSDEIIQLLGLAFLEPGDEVLSADPSFSRYEAAATLNQATYVALPLRDYRFDLSAMVERLNARTRVVFIANPNNPTGTLVARQELEAFLDRVPERAIVALDEAYFEYVDPGAYPDGLDYVRQGRNVLVMRTFSKIYALAGLRVGYGIARAEIVDALHQVREPFNVNVIAQDAAVASLEDPEQVARARRVNAEGREYLAGAFRTLDLPFIPSQANFVLVDVRQDCRGVYQQLLGRGVIVRSGDSFGLPTHLRVTIGTREQNERFTRALREALGG